MPIGEDDANSVCREAAAILLHEGVGVRCACIAYEPHKSVEDLFGPLGEPLAREAKAVKERKEGGGGFGPFGGGVFGSSLPPRMFFEKRTVEVASQLAGKSKGFVPQPFVMPGFGGPGGFQAPARPGEVLGAGVQQALRLSADQKKRLAELQKEIDGKLEKLLTEDQRAQLKRMREARPGGPGFGPGGPGGPGGGFPGGPPPAGLVLVSVTPRTIVRLF